jgi:spore germination cell wall hydrolase CwlJ-like protein
MKSFKTYINENKQLDEKWTDVVAAGLIGGAAMIPQTLQAAAHKPSIRSGTPITQSSAAITDISDAVAKTLWAEARGEGSKGIDAVATVIYNRAGRNPNKVIGVITKPKQFESWKNGPPLVKIRNANDKKIWDYCQKIGQEIENGTFKPLGKYNHFYNPSGARPSWAKGRQYTQIGQHHFLTI